MISFFKVFLKANLWRDFVSSLNEFQIFAPRNLILRKSKGRPGSKSCIVLVTFIDSCEIIREGWWQSARMESYINVALCRKIMSSNLIISRTLKSGIE